MSKMVLIEIPSEGKTVFINPETISVVSNGYTYEKKDCVKILLNFATAEHTCSVNILDSSLEEVIAQIRAQT